MLYYVYILYSAQLDLFYIGSSEDPEIRLSKHLANHKGFTGKAKDWKIVYTERYSDKSEALKREKQLKNWKNRLRIQQLIEKAPLQGLSEDNISN
jgi:putative endonuclease